MAFALLFPGQGSQSLKMMDGFADVSIVRQTFDEASRCLGDDLWAMLQAETNDRINATVYTQPLMLVAGVATWRAWLEQGGTLPDAVAGHSLGEYTALVAAGALDFVDAVRLVRLRAELMQHAVPVGQGAMAAVLGLDDDSIRAACAEAASHGAVDAANFNAPGQVIIAGECLAVEQAIALCKARGAKRALRLPISVPSHCRLMNSAAEQLRMALNDVEFCRPRITVLHNADVTSYSQDSAIREALVRQLSSPVRWTETIQKLYAEGCGQMAECGPGGVLTGLVKRIDSRITCWAFTDPAALTMALSLC